jgi:site-specific recombinase XerD
VIYLSEKSTVKMLNDFLVYMRVVRNKAAKTTTEYVADLTFFFKFINLKNGDTRPYNEITVENVDLNFIKNIKTVDVLEFMNFLLEKRGNGRAARARKLSAIKTFFKYLMVATKFIDKSPVACLEAPKSEKVLPKFLDLKQSKSLLECIRLNGAEHMIRDLCIAQFFLNCGMRLSELQNINVGDIKSDGSLKLKGKGGKERIAYLNDACKEALADYLHVRRVPYGFSENALFLSRNGLRLSIKTIQYLFAKYFKIAGFEGFSVHKLRHTAATLMYRYAGADMLVLKEILGHENIATTEIYTHTNSEQIRKTIEANPISNLKFETNEGLDSPLS